MVWEHEEDWLEQLRPCGRSEGYEGWDLDRRWKLTVWSRFHQQECGSIERYEGRLSQMGWWKLKGRFRWSYWIYLGRFRCFRPIEGTDKVKDAGLVSGERFATVDVSEPGYINCWWQIHDWGIDESHDHRCRLDSFKVLANSVPYIL